MVDVGSSETHSQRRIFHILGQNGQGRAGRLLVSELYADDGCWNGYPPHKHDTDVPAMAARRRPRMTSCTISATTRPPASAPS